MELSKSLMVLLFAAVLKLQGCVVISIDLRDGTEDDNSTATTDPTTYVAVGSSIGLSGIPLAAVKAAEPGIAAGIADFMGSRFSSADVTIRSSENVPYDRRLALLQRRLASAITVDFEIRIPEDMFVESVESVLAKAASDPSVLFAGIADALSRDSTVLDAMAAAGYSGGVSPSAIKELMISVDAPTVHERPVYDCKKCPDGFFDGCNNCGCSGNALASCTMMACETRSAPPTCNDPVLGGVGDVKLADAKVQGIVDGVKDAAFTMMRDGGWNAMALWGFTAISYRTQVVAGTNYFGTNYFVKVQHGDADFVALRIYAPLPHTGQPPSLSAVKLGLGAGDDPDYFGGYATQVTQQSSDSSDGSS